jgi:gas vesicle protein
MNDFWPALVGALVGAAAAIVAAWMTASRQEQAEHRKWVREQKRQVYSDALRSLARATVVPIGTSINGLENWFRDLGLVREALITMQAHRTNANSELTTVIAELFALLDQFDFVMVATDAATLEAEGVDKTGLVLWGVASIRRALDRTLSKVAESAKNDLGQDIVV